VKIVKCEPERVEYGVGVWIVHRVTLEDGSVYEWAASADGNTESYWKPVDDVGR
jgi:hypothetical protein